jgi:hypothetical protein
VIILRKPVLSLPCTRRTERAAEERRRQASIIEEIGLWLYPIHLWVLKETMEVTLAWVREFIFLWDLRNSSPRLYYPFLTPSKLFLQILTSVLKLFLKFFSRIY